MVPWMRVLVCVLTLALCINFTSCAGEYQQCQSKFISDKYEFPAVLKFEASSQGQCSWYFKVPEGKFPEVIVTELDIGDLKYDYPHPDNCKNDKMWFMSGAGSFIGHYLCGKTSDYTTEQLTKRSTRRYMYLFFSNTVGRFEAQFKIVDTPGKSVCPTAPTELRGSGTINFAFDPHSEVQERECVWVIKAYPGMNTVALKVLKMFTPKSTTEGAQNTCVDVPQLQLYLIDMETPYKILCNETGEVPLYYFIPSIKLVFLHPRRKPYTGAEFRIDFNKFV